MNQPYVYTCVSGFFCSVLCCLELWVIFFFSFLCMNSSQFLYSFVSGHLAWFPVKIMLPTHSTWLLVSMSIPLCGVNIQRRHMFKLCFLIMEADTINGMTGTQRPLYWEAIADALMPAEPMGEAARRRSMKTSIGP